MREPSPQYEPEFAIGRGSSAGIPPVTATVYRQGTPLVVVLGERNRMFLPSGVQPTTSSGSGCYASRFGTPPAAGTTNTSVFPSYWPVNATCVPSGENAASLSSPGPAVRRRASPPSRDTIHKSPAKLNAICVLLMV